MNIDENRWTYIVLYMNIDETRKIIIYYMDIYIILYYIDVLYVHIYDGPCFEVIQDRLLF